MSRRKPPGAKQRGVSLPLLLIGTSILLVVFATIYETWRLARLAERGKTLATAVQPFHNALVLYGLANRTQLVATPTGAIAGAASPLQPTCTELKALMPSLLDYACTLPEQAGTPLFEVTPIPAGCAGVTCDLAFKVRTSNAIGTDADASEIVQKAVNHFGAEAGQSLVNDGGTIRGAGWTMTNPSGRPRSFGTYATYGASTLTKFLTVYDTRDPNFMGNVTVAGSIASQSGISVGDSTCKFTELTLDGRVIARSPTCVERVVANGQAGSVETRSATGATTVRINDRVAVFNSAGTDKAGIRFSASASEVYADSIRNNSSTAGINADGSTFASGTATVGALSVSNAQTPGAACPANTFARASDGRWMECFAGTWRFTGIHQANVGDTCVGGFAQDIGNATAPLICRNNVYVNLNRALGLVSIIDSMLVVDGSVVPPPQCPAGSVWTLMTDLMRFQTPSAGGAVRVGYTGTGPWTISLTGAGGIEALVWRGCQYLSF